MTALAVTTQTARIISAARHVYGDRWQRRLSQTCDLSPALLSMIARGERSLTDRAADLIVAAIRQDAQMQINMCQKALTILDAAI